MVAGEAEELETDRLFARDVNWISGAPQGDRLRAGVKIRYRHPEAQATLTCLPDRRIEVVFDARQRAVTPGQAAVLYDGEACLGGAWIE